MKIARKYFSLILCLILMAGLLPPAVANAAPGDPVSISEKSVEVTVWALRTTAPFENERVAGATVDLCCDGFVLKSAISDLNGVAVLPLDGLTENQIRNATVRAHKVIDRTTAQPEGSPRDTLFQNLPKDENGRYIRAEYELRSEKIDANGNWIGQMIPLSTSNQVDIAFVIDGTGSMDDEIENIRLNLATFEGLMLDTKYDVRYSVLVYRDVYYKEMPKFFEHLGSRWMTTPGQLAHDIKAIEPDGGGDYETETLGDALEEVLDDEMGWRSNAFRFVVMVTDAYNSLEDRSGSSVHQDNLNQDMKEAGIAAVMITKPELEADYRNLYGRTGGTYIDIDSPNISGELFQAVNTRVLSDKASIDLVLSEPRMYVNLSVCYLANDEASQSDSYRGSLMNMLSEYGKVMAQTTDGHVYIRNILLFSTASRLNFFNTKQMASMADIQIQTRENERNEKGERVTIHSNAHVNGFYSSETVTGKNSTEMFEKLGSTELNDLSGRKQFSRIQMSGYEGAGWNYSFIKNPREYAESLMHESGHYILGFFDEYFDAKKVEWRSKAENDKPYGAFGLMDNQHVDLEMSKNYFEYSYIKGYYGDEELPTTYHYSIYSEATEEVLAQLLTKGQTTPDLTHIIGSAFTEHKEKLFNSPYYATYTRCWWLDADRRAEYPDAGLTEGDFLSLPETGSTSSGLPAWGWGINSNTEPSPESKGEIEPDLKNDNITVEIDAKEGATYQVYVQTLGGDGWKPLDELKQEGNKITADVPLAAGELADIQIVEETGGVITYNSYSLDRSEPVSGYMYESPDGKVIAYAKSEGETSYLFMADDTSYQNGEYMSLNQATRILTEGAPITEGEIYSVASCADDLDFTSIAWFKYDNGNWMELPTRQVREENNNIGASASLSGNGLYVLMGKKAAQGEVEAPDFLMYDQSKEVDGRVTLSFDDINENVKFYNVYYSDDLTGDLNPDNAEKRVYEADACIQTSETGRELTLNLYEGGRAVQAAVEVVLEDGSRSPLSSLMVVAGEADRDEDGIPDWYADKYHLWTKTGKSPANLDPDNDGLTNLEEYMAGTDPLVPDLPELSELEQAQEIIRQQKEQIRRLEQEIQRLQRENQGYVERFATQQRTLDGYTADMKNLSQKLAELEAKLAEAGK